MNQRRWLRGIPIDFVDMTEAVARCLTHAADPRLPPLRVLTLNPEMHVAALKDKEFAECFRGETLVVPDGTGIVIAGRCRGWRGLHRVPGIDLLLSLTSEAARYGLPVFLHGGRPGVAEQAAEVLRRRFPGLLVCGTAHGFLPSEESARLPAAIAASGARVVFAGLGTPRQDLWLAANLVACGAGVGVGVGGSFDVIAGRARRAPRLLRRLGLEWVYRVWREPGRWRRLLVIPRFLCGVLWPGREGEG